MKMAKECLERLLSTAANLRPLRDNKSPYCTCKTVHPLHVREVASILVSRDIAQLLVNRNIGTGAIPMVLTAN